ncbi:MAG: hypothetical protein ABI616_08395 [Pseudomonadota bacterium]
MKQRLRLLCLAMLAAPAVCAQAAEEIHLWPGKAPGTQNWSIPESVTTSPRGGCPWRCSARAGLRQRDQCYLALFAAWKAAARPAELHVYDGISTGFGMSARGLPVDGWIDRMYEWLLARQLTTQR